MAIDFYNNVLTNFHDNPFEIDGGRHNIRVLRNVMLNAASHAVCNQPSIGGPAYWLTNYSSSDHNGFRPNPGAAVSFAWDSPPAERQADFASLIAPTPPGGVSPLVTRQFATLADYARATSQERSSVLVDYDIFQKVPPLSALDRATVQKVHPVNQLDFRPRPGTAAVDAGVALPNVTEGFAGRAPDLGALELNAPLPHYGPRR